MKVSIYKELYKYIKFTLYTWWVCKILHIFHHINMILFMQTKFKILFKCHLSFSIWHRVLWDQDQSGSGQCLHNENWDQTAEFPGVLPGNIFFCWSFIHFLSNHFLRSRQAQSTESNLGMFTRDPVDAASLVDVVTCDQGYHSWCVSVLKACEGYVSYGGLYRCYHDHWPCDHCDHLWPCNHCWPVAHMGSPVSPPLDWSSGDQKAWNVCRWAGHYSGNAYFSGRLRLRLWLVMCYEGADLPSDLRQLGSGHKKNSLNG